jgi:alcohol dehydrogenase
MLVKKPDNISHVEAAAIPLVGMTTTQSFQKAKLSPKDKVLILGGAGGTGTFAIQYAKHVLDLYVITTCSEKNIELCKSLGADEVIDYKKEDFSTKLKDLDFVYDTTGEAEKSFSVLKKNGKCCSIATIPHGQAARENSMSSEQYFFVPTLLDALSSKTRFLAYMKSIDYEFVFLNVNGKDLEEIATYLADGKIKAVIDKTFELEKATEAFDYIEKGRTVGKNCFVIKS